MVFPWDSVLSYFYNCHSSYRHFLHTLGSQSKATDFGHVKCIGMDSSVRYEYWGPLTTLLMIFAGLSGSGVLSVFTEGNIGPQNVDILNTLTTPIALSIGILSIGVICGGLAYILTYIKGNNMVKG
jgi:hypothetical protein